MNEENNHKPKPRRKPFLWVVFFLLLFTAGSTIYLIFNLERFVNENLSKFVYEKTDHKYRLNFESVKIDFFNKNLTISNVTLLTDTISSKDSTQTNLFFKTRYLKISKIKIWPLIRDRRFVAESFKIEAPEINLERNEKLDLDFLSKNKLAVGDTLDIPFFAELFFDTLAVLNAQFNIDTLLKTDHQQQQINLVANHFKLGGIKFTDTPYPFDVSDLSLTLDHFNEILPDSLHRITISEINLSLLHSTIKAKNVSLKPLNDSVNTAKNIYSIDVPEIHLKSTNIDELHQLDTITIQSMEFINPSIAIKFGSRVLNGTPLNEINFHELTGDQLKWIKIDLFSIKNANVKFTPSKSSEVAQHFEGLFVNFYDFKIDSASYRDKNRIISASHLSLTLNQFTLNHNDKVHQLVINDLSVDSRTEKISTGNVSFKPINIDQPNNITNIYINSSSLTCNGVNLLEFYHNKELPMKELFIEEPRIQINFKQKKNIKKNERDNSLILEKISDYLTGVYVDSTRITDGRIRLNYVDANKKEGFFKSDFNLELKNISVDSTTFEHSDKIFFAENFDAAFNDLTLQLADETHQLTTRSIHLSSGDKIADIEELRILPKTDLEFSDSVNFQNNAEFFNIHFPRIKLSGANLHRAFFDKKLFINTITISNPAINIEKFGDWKTNNVAKTPYQSGLYAMISDFLLNINILNLNMNNGVLKMVQHQQNEPRFEMSNLFSIKMINFELDANSAEKPNKLFFSDDIDLILKDHSFTLADGVHKVDTDEIGILSSEKRIYIRKAKIYPDILVKSFEKTPISVFATIPDLQIIDADIFGFFNKGNFPVSDVVIQKPDIKLLFQEVKNSNQTDDEQKERSLLNEFKSVSAQRIKIIDGLLELAKYEDYKSKTLATTRINFEIDHFNIHQTEGTFKTCYSDFKFDLTDLNLKLDDQIHALAIQKANYHLNSEELGIKNISIQPLPNNLPMDKKLYFVVQIPEIRLTKFNAKSFINTKKIDINHLMIDQPKIKITDNRIEKKDHFSPYQLDLYPTIHSFSESFRAQKISVYYANIDLNNKRKVLLKNINLTAQNFIIDQNSSKQKRFFNSDRVDLNINNLNGKTNGNYFQYNIDQLMINSEGDFSVNGISLVPLYSEEEFAKKKIYQADYFNIKNANVAGNGLNIEQLVENHNFMMNELNVELEEFKTHRDKSYPLIPNIRTKLPQQALRDLKFGLSINKTVVNIDYFQFTEREPGAVQNSMVFVTDAKAELTNITNNREKLNKQPNLLASIQGKLMGIGDADVQLKLNVPSFGNEFTCKASCGPMPLNVMNPIIEPGLKISIKEGMNQKMEVYFEANEDSSIGNILFAYNDLKISVLSSRDGEIREGKLISFLVNSIALKTDNPKPGRILLPAKFENHRDKQRSVVGYCWKSIYAGIKATLGIKEKED